jgi:hypothetical protein
VPRPVEVPSPTPRRSCSARRPPPATRRVSSPQQVPASRRLAWCGRRVGPCARPRQGHPTTNTPKGRTRR